MEIVTSAQISEAVLLSYQQKWVADKSDVKLAEKSRRTGYTWCEASDNVLEAAVSKKDGGMDVMYMGTSKDMAREYIDTCAEWAKKYDKACSDIEEETLLEDEKEICVFRIKFASGNSIQALSSKPRSLRGHQGKVVIDESAFQDDLKEIVKAAMAMLMWGGRVVIISTHNGISNYFNELIQQSRAGKLPYSIHRTTLDDALEQGLYKRICLVGKKEWSKESEAFWRNDLIKKYGSGADEELHCIPSQSSGSYLSYATIAGCQIDGIPILKYQQKDTFAMASDEFRKAETLAWCKKHLKPLLMKLKPEFKHYFGQDFARSGDLSVIWPLAMDSKMHRHTPFLIEMRNIPHEQQKQILFYMIKRMPRFTAGAMDAGGNGSYLAEVTQQEFGECVERVIFSQKWYIENMPKYKAALEDRDVSLPKNDNVMSDHQAIQLVAGVPKVPAIRQTDEKGDKRHGDSAIAAALAYMATLAEVGVYEHEAAGNSRDSNNLDDYV